MTANTFNNVNYTVKTGATLQMEIEPSYLNGDGIFTLEAGAKLGIKSIDGITSSGATGHIQTATRNFSTGADYEYNGISLQSTGSGLPSSVRNLTINNGSHIILTNSVNAENQLNLLVGNVTTGSNSITLGTSDVSTGTLSRTSGHIIGSLRRWVPSAVTTGIIFPVGTPTSFNGIIMDFNTPPNGGIITSSFTTGFPGVYGLPITDAGDVCSTIGSGWWTLSGSNGFSGGEYNISTTAEGFTGISDYTKLHLFRRDDDANVWTAEGTHVAATGNSTTPIANRSAFTSLGQFGITSTSINPLPVEIVAFDVMPYNSSAKITWTTASEKNSDYFVVERSKDNKNFEEIQKVTGAVIHIEEKNEKGMVEVSADNKESLEAAVNRIKAIVAVPEVGATYEGKVKNIMPFGAFVEFMPGKDGLLHISEISWARLETMDGVFKEGDVVKVKLMEVDRQGKFKLSRKALMPKPERKPEGNQN